MKPWQAVWTLVALGAAASPAPPTTMAAMRWHRRIVLVATPALPDRRAVRQRRALRDWAAEAADRDVSLVEVSGDMVTGAADDAASLRRRYGLRSGAFAVLLIGKDGNVALRSSHPITAVQLQGTIDAMPIRRAGER